MRSREDTVQAPHLVYGVVGEDNHRLRGLSKQHALTKIQILVKLRRSIKPQREVEVVGCLGMFGLRTRGHVEEFQELGKSQGLEQTRGYGKMWRIRGG